MKKSILALLCASTSLTMFTGAVEVRELSLNGPSYTPNVTVKPMDNQLEMTKHTLSYDNKLMNYNHEYAGAKHVIDRLPLSQQTKIMAYSHESVLDQYFAPQIKEGGLTLREIVDRSPYNTSTVNTVEDAVVFMREVYSQKFNEYFPAQVLSKDGNLFEVKLNNFSKYPITAVEGNLRFIDSQTGRILYDADIKESVRIAPNRARVVPVYIATRNAGWKEKHDNLAYKFVTTAVVLSGGIRYSADELYQKHTERLQKKAKQQ
jgi:hypothetical protein